MFGNIESANGSHQLLSVDKIKHFILEINIFLCRPMSVLSKFMIKYYCNNHLLSLLVRMYITISTYYIL